MYTKGGQFISRAKKGHFAFANIANNANFAV